MTTTVTLPLVWSLRTLEVKKQDPFLRATAIGAEALDGTELWKEGRILEQSQGAQPLSAGPSSCPSALSVLCLLQSFPHMSYSRASVRGPWAPLPSAREEPL